MKYRGIVGRLLKLARYRISVERFARKSRAEPRTSVPDERSE